MSSFDAEFRRRSPVIEFSCQYPTDPRGRQRIHHRLMGAVDLMDLDLAAGRDQVIPADVLLDPGEDVLHASIVP